jgi:hypothetical protein
MVRKTSTGVRNARDQISQIRQGIKDGMCSGNEFASICSRTSERLPEMRHISKGLAKSLQIGNISFRLSRSPVFFGINRNFDEIGQSKFCKPDLHYFVNLDAAER